MVVLFKKLFLFKKLLTILYQYRKIVVVFFTFKELLAILFQYSFKRLTILYQTSYMANKSN
jgi:hypothetical protein